MCDYFTNISEFKSAPIATFPFDTFVLCKDRHLHIPKYRMPNCKEETPPIGHKMEVSTSICAINVSDENEMFDLNDISKHKEKKI